MAVATPTSRPRPGDAPQPMPDASAPDAPLAGGEPLQADGPLPAAPASAAPLVAGPLPAAPRLGRSVRASVTDLYFNSWRLVPMNLVWGVMLLAILALASFWSVVALLALPVLALPIVGMARMSTLIVREQAVALADGFGAWRRSLVPALLLGAGLVLGATVLSINVLIGLRDGGLVTVAVATLAAWGLVVLAGFAVAAWPLLADPARDGLAARERLRLAGLLVVAHPVRMLGLTAFVLVFLALSTLAFAALLTVSVALASQIGARYVLPASDRLEARMAAARAARGG